MANYKRKRPRAQAGGYYSGKGLAHRLGAGWHDRMWLSNWPRHWDVVHHTRPTRARTRAALAAILKGGDPDETLWPLPRKPHKYYW